MTDFLSSSASGTARVKALLAQGLAQCVAWVTRDEHKQKARELADQVEKAFTDHPHSAGETYLEHLWFTTKMMARLIYSGVVVLIHGIFPFLLMRTASSQLEQIYLIMKSRIPEARRNEIDTHPDAGI